MAIERLEGGATIALVTDAGTPLVSDPGGRLVRAAVAAVSRGGRPRPVGGIDGSGRFGAVDGPLVFRGLFAPHWPGPGRALGCRRR